jgi:nucleoid DNA-binding protein
VNVDSEGYKDRIKQVDVETIINTFLQEMSQCMIVGDDIVLRGFGKFMSKIRKARTKYNSICKTELTFPERRFIKFNISKRIDKHIKGEEGHE